MTVKELKQAIVNLKDDATISFQMASGCCGDYEHLDTIEGFEFETYSDTALVIYFGSLPGYKSCRQAGGTIQSDIDYWKDK